MLETIDAKIIAIVSLATSALSVVGASSILLYVLCIYKCKQKEVFPLWQIWFGDLIAAVLQSIGSLLYILKVKNDILCNISTSVTPSFYVVTFLLTMMYALEMLFRKRKMLQDQRVQNKTYSSRLKFALNHHSLMIVPPAVGTSITFSKPKNSTDLQIVPPAVGTAITFSKLNNSTELRCLPVFHLDDSRDNTNLTHKLLFFIPLILVLLINTGLLASINHIVKKHNIRRGHRERRIEQTLFKRMLAYQITLFICWLPSIFLGFGTVIAKNTFQMSTFYPVYILQAILAPLQGFINCIAYGWSRILMRELPPEQRGLLKRLKVFRANNSEILFEDTNYQSF